MLSASGTLVATGRRISVREELQLMADITDCHGLADISVPRLQSCGGAQKSGASWKNDILSQIWDPYGSSEFSS